MKREVSGKMKIVRDLPPEDGARAQNEAQRDDFFDEMDAALFEAVCRGLDAQQHPMALVSGQLMVIRQTKNCRALLEDAAFYSIESALPPETCGVIRQVIRTGAQQTAAVMLFEQPWEMRVLPAQEGALLVFSPEMPRQVGISMAAASLRTSASHLLGQAETLETLGQAEQACALRREAMRILREANHTQVLSGAPEPIHREICDAGQLLVHARESLLARGVCAELTMCVRSDKANALCLAADEALLLSAVMALVSNSLRHGGADVAVTLSVEQQEDCIVLGVDDDGPGLSACAMERMNDTWRQPDALLGSWGLGIPYVRRIVQMHGGTLLFTQREEGGCAARIRLPRETGEERLESASFYDTGMLSAAGAADVELSDVLDAAAYRRE